MMKLKSVYDSFSICKIINKIKSKIMKLSSKIR